MDPRGGTVFVGRAAELERLCQWAVAPSSSAVVVTGEAGIGKSALVSAFAGEAAARGFAPVVVGHCAALAGAGLPFIALTQVLRALLGDRTEREQEKLLGPQRLQLARLLPEIAEDPMGLPSSNSTDELALFDAVLQVFRRVGPLITVVEDMQWMTRSGLELFEYLLHGQDDALHLLGTCSSDELADRADLRRLVREAGRAGLVATMPLGPLGRPEVETIVTAVYGEPPAPETVDRVASFSGGNPLFAVELARHDLSGAKERVPPQLSELLTLGMATLDEDARSVVHAVAVGGEVPHQILAAVTKLPAARLERATATAVAARLLETTIDGGGYRCRHDLARAAVYEQVLPGERLRLHSAYAAALAATATQGSVDLPALASLVQHHRCAGADADAARWSLAAADAAESASAFGDALRLYQQALDLPPIASGLVDTDRLEVLMRAIRAADLAGDHDAGLSLTEEALQFVDEGGRSLRAAPLVDAVHTLARRARIHVPDEPASGDDDVTVATGPPVVLTSREQEILRLVAAGLTNRSIAARLVVSPKTVDTHVTHVLAKLNAHDRVTAAARAARLGLLA